LRHDTPQGTKLVDVVKSVVPDKETQIIIATEAEPGIGNGTFKTEEGKVAALSLDGAFSELKEYYGEKLSFQYVDEKALYHVSLLLDTAADKLLLEKSEASSFRAMEKQAVRELLSVSVAKTYVGSNFARLRSKEMLKKIKGLKTSAPDAVIILVAGSEHVDDISRALALTGAERVENATLQVVALNTISQVGATSSEFAEKVAYETELERTIEDVMGGEKQFDSIFFDVMYKIATVDKTRFADSQAEREWINGVARETIQNVADIICKSSIETEKLMPIKELRDAFSSYSQ
jgi:hypothetical protein